MLALAMFSRSVCLARSPENYAWSSARHHLDRRRADPLDVDDTVVRLVGNWRAFLKEAKPGEAAELEKRLSSGRPWGSPSFVDDIERVTKRALSPGKGGWPKGRPRKRRS